MLDDLDAKENPVDATLLSAQDDFPLWSAPFGLMLLDHIRLRPNLKALDIGFGSGFPLLELAQILGSSSKMYQRRCVRRVQTTPRNRHSMLPKTEQRGIDCDLENDLARYDSASLMFLPHAIQFPTVTETNLASTMR